MLFVAMMISIVTMSAQIRFSADASVYDNKTNQTMGKQYIAADINSNGVGTMTLGSLKMSARVNSSKRDNVYKMTAYSVTLRSQNGKTVDVVITLRDKRTCTVVVYYAEATLRYDFSF